MTLRRFVALALFLLVQGAAVWLVAAIHARAPAGALTQAVFVAGDRALTHSGGSAGEPVRLPHVWAAAGHRDLSQGSYRLLVPTPSDRSEIQAVLLWQVGSAPRVSLNGSALSMATQAAPRAWSQPKYFPVPPDRWRVDANELTIQVSAFEAGAGFMGPIYVGSEAALRPHFEARRFLKVGLINVSAVVLLVIASALCLLGFWRGGSNVYVWLGIAGLAWSGSALVYTLPGGFSNSVYADWFFVAMTNAVAVALAMFIHRYLELPRSVVERWLLRLAILGNGGLLLLAATMPHYFYPAAQSAWAPLSYVLFIYAAWLLFKRYWHSPVTSGYWLMQAIALTLSFSTYDILVYGRQITPVQGLWADYAAPSMLIAFTLIVLWRFHLALRESETLNLELADRVKQKEREIEATYAALRESEQQRTLADERERIQRDMHDGLGGTLVSTLAGLDLQGEKDSAAAQSLRSALDDLRLMIYSLDQTSGTLRAALAMLRERLGRLADDAGLALEWNMQELPPELALERGATLQLMRIVQEAFTNTVKHARAKTFRVTARPDGAGVTLEMCDDGAGFDPAVVKPGSYGLANMRARAQKIGGQLECGSAAPGTRVALRMPIS